MYGAGGKTVCDKLCKWSCMHPRQGRVARMECTGDSYRNHTGMPTASNSRHPAAEVPLSVVQANLIVFL